MEKDEDLKAADFLRYYLRNKTLQIWRMVDVNSKVSGMGATIYPGLVDQKAVREKLAKQLMIDLEDFEKVQIHPERLSHSLFEEGSSSMDEYLENMEPLTDGEDCKVELKALGEYLVKLHLKGGQSVGLRLVVMKR